MKVECKLNEKYLWQAINVYLAWLLKCTILEYNHVLIASCVKFHLLLMINLWCIILKTIPTKVTKWCNENNCEYDDNPYTVF